VDIDEEELARQALAADPDVEVADDAEPMPGIALTSGYGLLPGWYMPAPGGTGLVTGWRRIAAIAVIVALVAIVAFGLCSTDGYVTIA
jgi:hypothetical protein